MQAAMSRPIPKLALALAGGIILVAAALVLVIELRVRPLYDPARLGFAMPVVAGLLGVVPLLAGGLMVVTLRRAGAALVVPAPLPIDLPDLALSGGNEEVGAMMGAFSRILGRI